MKYPWTALSLIIIWIATTYIVIKTASLNVNYILLVTLAGTVIISLIGFRTPTLRK
ncbi:MAG: hypothetical protein HY481_02460 [Candidatus Vogelbacteria bacterium]|nr:hypothetical protein [Candidatus Vogelbacteria bacterium]